MMASSEQKERGKGIPGWLEWVITIAVGVILALLVRAFVAEVYIVPSGSMLDTIQEGDRLLGEKVTYKTSSPKRGDIVTFDDPEKPGTTLIKRVIAVAGDTVDLRNGFVYVNGKKLSESYTEGKPSYPLEQYSSTLGEAISYPYKVPAGHIWVMGDNRTNSLDSRYFGAVSVDSVSSRAVFIFWPFKDARGL